MRARRSYRLALAAGLGVLGAVAAWLAGALNSGTEQMPVAAVVRSSPSAGATLAKFYVVSEPSDGQREFLFDVAARTLGDGKRYLEIFELNKGR
jgi:hypothetical protein